MHINSVQPLRQMGRRAAFRFRMIGHMAAHGDVVQLGSTVVVRDERGEEQTYQVVAPAEASPREGRVSSGSPVGRALLGRRVGEAVVIPAPGGSFTVRVEAVDTST